MTVERRWEPSGQISSEMRFRSAHGSLSSRAGPTTMPRRNRLSNHATALVPVRKSEGRVESTAHMYIAYFPITSEDAFKMTGNDADNLPLTRV